MPTSDGLTPSHTKPFAPSSALVPSLQQQMMLNVNFNFRKPYLGEKGTLPSLRRITGESVTVLAKVTSLLWLISGVLVWPRTSGRFRALVAAKRAEAGLLMLSTGLLEEEEMSMESSERRDTGSGVLGPPPPMMERGWV
ncbi:hypothetical protein EYF80_018816 [Liparis tanakae]|uniref:Uncharacterized protein n=1 Tax=Liparis tanakae TaxID=230148 RepID=A0A4Z2HZM6_9TELE|nr:hypothetical protein EYF80_018816 [Liparis tanakae]